MYSYCWSFKFVKLTNYLKAYKRESMGIDDLRIPFLLTNDIYGWTAILAFST